LLALYAIFLKHVKVDWESKDVEAFTVWETVSRITMESKMAATESNYP